MGAALNDLAYAVNDTIKDPAKFKALNVLMQEMINNMVLQALNNNFGTENMLPLNVLLNNAIANHGVKEFTANGTFVVPEGVNIIFVTACGGGGGGGGPYTGHNPSNDVGGCGSSGGAGAAAIFRKAFSVVPGQSIPITIGTAGAAGASNKDGGAGGTTVIGSLISLPGGAAGKCYSGNIYMAALPGGDGGGFGGSEHQHATNGITGSGGSTVDGYGGGGSLGNGGRGSYTDSGTATAASVGNKGSGGGGGSYFVQYSTKKTGAAGKGGSGYCLIEW